MNPVNAINPAAIRILVVDDDPDIARGTSRVLERAGYATVTALSGTVALQSVLANRPDLVLLDRDMPEVDGMEVCRRLKSDPALAEIFVILTSGVYIGSEEQAAGLNLGADGYIARPVTNRELLARVQAFVRIVSLNRSLRQKTAEAEAANEALQQSRSAALNLVDDALAARKEAESALAALRVSEQEFRSLAEAMPQIVWACRPDGGNIYFNQQWVDYTGLTLEESYGAGWNKPFHPDDQQRAWEAWRNATENDGVYSLECRLRRADGVYRWWLIRGVPLRSASGKILKWFGTCTDIQDIKQAEENLARINQQHELILTSAAEGILGVDLQGDHTFVNPAAARMLGCEVEELLGRSSHRAWHHTKPDGRPYPKEECPIYAAYRDGLVHRADTDVFWRKDGTSFPVEYASTPIYEQGRLVGAVVTFSDITERKQAEEELRHDEARFRSLTEILQYRAEKTQDFLDFALEQAIKLTGSKLGYIYFYHEDRKQFVLNTWSKEVMKECSVVNPQTCYELDKTGVWGEAVRQRRPIMLNDFQAAHPLKKGYPEGHAPLHRYLTVPVFSGDEIVAVAAVANKEHDYDQADIEQLRLLMDAVWKVVERRNASEALVTSEDRFRRAVLDSPFPIILHAEDGAVLQVSNSWCEITGYTREELATIGDWTERAYGERKQLVQADIDALYGLDHRKYEGDYVIRTKSGGTRIWEFSSAPLGRLPDERRLVISMALDATERRQAEREVRRLNAELEQRVQDRTAQLAAANQELEAFSYSVSHDLRSPLRAIIGFGRLLAKSHADHLDPEGLRLLGVVQSEAQRMSTLIDDLLAFSRANRQSLRFALLDMGALAQTVWEECRAQAPNRQLHFTLQPLPAAHGDPALLRQVLVNLLGNAVKYTKPRALAEVEMGGRSDPGESVYWVKDNGAGFDMKYADKLFGVFQRLHSEAEFEGTGVGLALVQRILQRHGGRIWAEASLNEGATFYFTLPTSQPSP